MKPNILLARLVKLYGFFGKKSSRLLLFGVLTGVIQFCIEVTFGYFLQAFLVVLKVVPSEMSMNFPSWLPVESPSLFLAVTSIILLSRGIIRWIHAYLISASAEYQRTFQRTRLNEWLFSSKSISMSDFTNLYNAGVDSVCITLSSLQNIAILISLSFLIFAYLLKISIPVTLISFAILFALGLITRKIDHQISTLGKKNRFEVAAINRNLISNLKNLLLLQIYGTQQKERDFNRDKLNSVLQNMTRYFRFYHMKNFLPQTLGIILICIICVYSTQQGLIPSGLMITYFYLFQQFVQNFSEAIKLGSGVSYHLQTSSDFAKWWADHSYDGIRNRFDPNQKKKAIPLTEAIGWDFSGVSFRYESQNKALFERLDLKINPGSCAVITGGSGSGKSTIISMALGLTEPQEGEIRITTSGNSTSITEVKEDLLKSVGYVGPESFLIEGTIEENLLYGLDQNPKENEIKKALELAECDFVNDFPSGLNHLITDQGQGLSAGQKQRISFARALLRNPKILILDEATSNLDSETEGKIVSMIGKLKGKMTILAVTHREKILHIADQTIKLD